MISRAYVSFRLASAAVLLVFVAALCAAPRASAQSLGLDPAAMLKPPTDTWPTYNGDYTGRRYSTLDQINSKNVDSLTLAWVFSSHGLNLKSTPLEVNGILYFSSPDHVWAVDARRARLVCHSEDKSVDVESGPCGVGVYK